MAESNGCKPTRLELWRTISVQVHSVQELVAECLELIGQAGDYPANATMLEEKLLSMRSHAEKGRAAAYELTRPQ